MGFPGGSVVKNSPANVGDAGLILGLGRSPGEGSGNPLQYSCVGNPMDRGAWWTTVHGGRKRVAHDLSSPGSLVHGLSQARILEWVAISFPGDLPDPGIKPWLSALQADSLPSQPPGTPNNNI